MSIRRAAFAALLAMAACAHAQVPSRLTLDQALSRTLAQHPELVSVGFLARVLEGEARTAALEPPLRIGVDLENGPAIGSQSGLRNAETTLSLAGVLERGGKREARQALAARRIDALAMKRTATELDLAAEVARRYLDLAVAEGGVRIEADEIEQRSRAADAARRRVVAGAAPESVRLGAEALLARARIAERRRQLDRESAWRRLQALWGATTDEASAPMPVTGADPLALPDLASFDVLQASLARSPEIRQFADERRLREARLRLAQASGASDVEWRAGVRRLESSDALAFVGGVSLALGARGRAAAAVDGARAELEAVDAEREAGERRLESLLAQADGEYRAAAEEVRLVSQDLLPRLEAAETAAESAYRAGAIAYPEWAALQSETTAARRAQLAAAREAHVALIEIQRLTAEPVVAAAGMGERR